MDVFAPRVIGEWYVPPARCHAVWHQESHAIGAGCIYTFQCRLAAGHDGDHEAGWESTPPHWLTTDTVLG